MAMRIRVKPTVAALLCGLALCASWAQEEHRQTRTSSTSANQGLKTEDRGCFVLPAILRSTAAPVRWKNPVKRASLRTPR
jgi:hypothetical protein